MRCRSFSDRKIVFSFFSAIVFGGFLFLIPIHAVHAANLPLSSSTLIADPNLISYYSMEDNANDYEGVNNGYASSMTYSNTSSTGKFGDGAVFNGSNSQITFSATDTMPTSGRTVLAWIYVNSFNTLGQPIFAGGSAGTDDADFFRTGCIDGGTEPSADRLAFEIWGHSSVYSNPGILTAGAWHQVGYTWDGSHIHLYIDGIDETDVKGVSDETPVGWAFNSNGGIGYAFGGTTSNAHFNGSIDDVSVFSRALSATEIADLYQVTIVSISSSTQYYADGATFLPEGGFTNASTVTFGAALYSNGVNNLKLRVEVRQAGTSFENTSTVTSASYVAPGGNATATYSGSSGDYHWQASAIDTSGVSSTWQIFGANDSSTDFAIDVTPPIAGELYDSSFYSDPDLLSYYRMEYSSHDYAGPNQGVDTNIAYSSSTGKFGAGANFDGSTSKILFTATDTMPTAARSVFVWIYVNSFNTFGQPILAGGNAGTNDADFFRTGTTNGGTEPSADRIVFEIWGHSSVYSDAGYLTADAWHQVGYTWDGSNITLYIDGVDRTQSRGASNAAPIGWTFDDNGGIGYAFGGTTSNPHFDGSIDDVSVFSRALSPTEVAELYGIPLNYYAKIEDTSTLNLRSQSSTTSSILKILPADWIIQVVSNTDSSGDPIISGGVHWFKVSDPTDGVTGWMAASDTSNQYISSYDGSAQAELEASSTAIADKTGRVDALVDALNNYYTNDSTSSSLYSSDDYTPNVISGLHISDEFNSSTPSTTFPEPLVLGMAAAESGVDSDTAGTNNGIVGSDIAHAEYGNGIMQLTVKYQPKDIEYLQRVLNSDPNTVVATSGAGSFGNETDSFGDLTENAVERFQAEYGITGDATGTVATSTLAELNSILSGSPTSSITELIPSGWRFNMEQDRPYVEMATEAVADANPSEYILYDENEQGGYDNRTYNNGLKIPPCGDFADPASSSFFENCYLNSSPNGYTTSTPYGLTFAYYANTPQSIFANVKGALNLMVGDYNPTSTTATIGSTTYSGIERSWFTDLWHYNGGINYLATVASSMIAFADYNVSGNQLVPTSTQTVQLVNDLDVAYNNYTEFLLFSPGDPQIVDSLGRVTGMVNGKVEEDIPGSAYDPETNTAVVLMTDDSFTYKVTGTQSADYGLEIVSVRNGKKVIFNNQAIPIQKGAIHSYTIDFNKLLAGQKGVTMNIDTKGDGTIDKVETFGPSAKDISPEATIWQSQTNPYTLNGKVLSPIVATPIPKPIVHPYVPPISVPVYPTSTPTSTLFVSTSSLSVDSTTIEAFSTSTTTSTIINSSTNQ